MNCYCDPTLKLPSLRRLTIVLIKEIIPVVKNMNTPDALFANMMYNCSNIKLPVKR